MRGAPALAIAMLVWPTLAAAHDSAEDQRLPAIGPAPDFALTSQDGAHVELADFRGRVLAVTFIYTTCADTCPLLTAKMVQVQDAIGPALFGPEIAFVAITVDPVHDNPAVLKRYAETFGADLGGWSFLTGSLEATRAAMRGYGVYASDAPAESAVDHTFLTSLVDRHGILRVQYLGVRFDPEEFRHDLLGLLGDAN